MADSDAMARFLAKGGKVQTVPENKKSDYDFNFGLKGCTCGCNGNYTDHQMRKGERGIL